MKAVARIEGKAIPIMKANIDTDVIMPKQFLKSVERRGFGPFIFDAWRYLDKGEMGMDCSRRPQNPDFPMNQERYKGATILLAGENFGCGSSREHAPWGLSEAGFEAIIAPSFADIFYQNAMKNGLLLIRMPLETIESFVQSAEASEQWRIDLPSETITLAGKTYAFSVPPSDKVRLMSGLDDIGMTLAEKAAIQAYEKKRQQKEPWIFKEPIL